MTRSFGLLAAAIAIGGCAELPRPRSGETAALELERFGDFLRNVHPAPFRFVDEAAFDALLDAESTLLRATTAPTELDVGRSFQRVAAGVHDVHLQVTLPSFQPGRDGELRLLPFVVAEVEGAWTVDAAAPGLPVGSRLVAIDGIPIEAVVDELAELAIFEGRNEDARAAVLARDFAKLHLFGFGARPEHAIAFEPPEGGTSELVVASIGRDESVALAAARRTRAIRRASDEPWPSVVLEADGTPRILLPTFGVADQEAYASHVSAIVATVADAPQLILDLRGNEGGLRTNGIALANHLASAPYVQWLGLGARVRAIPARFEREVAPAFGASLDRLRAFPAERTGELFRLDGDPLAARMVPASPHLAPALVVLVDGLTGSAANEFALAIRTLRPDAVFVGEEVGGGCDRHVGELPVTYTTETFGVIVLVSLLELVHVATPGCTEGRGLQPDVRVALDRAHFERSRDPAVEAALAAFSAR